MALSPPGGLARGITVIDTGGPLTVPAGDTLLGRMLNIYGLPALAAGHASRLASVQAAERNIDERLDAMQGLFRSRRQQAITEELLDVVAGFEVLSIERPGES